MRQITSRRFLTVITILAALSFAQPGRPQSPSQKAPGRDMNRERVIWQRLEKVAPKSVETFKAATEAFDKQDYERAATLYRQVMEQAPSFDPVYRRLGSTLALSGKTDEEVLPRTRQQNESFARKHVRAGAISGRAGRRQTIVGVRQEARAGVGQKRAGRLSSSEPQR